MQDVLSVDLSAALESYRQHISRITDAVRLLAQQRIVWQHIERGDVENLAGPLQAFHQNEDLDILFLTDAHGQILLPVRNQGHKIEVAGISMMVEQALRQRKEVASTVVFPASQLANQTPDLVERARIDVVPTSHAGSEPPGNVSDGLFAAAAVPVVATMGSFSGCFAERNC